MAGEAMGPVAVAERITAMDVLRGFALLGILLMNIEGMAGPLSAAMGGVDPALTGADRVVDTLIYLLVQGKFYPLFSLLFGMGFAVMLARAQAREQPFFAVYLRRILSLLAIGLVHAWLIWAGDILVAYALIGFVLLLFYRRTPMERLVGWGVFWMLLPSVFMLLMGALGSLAQLSPESAADVQARLQEQGEYFAALNEAQRQAYGSGSFAEATARRMEDFAETFAYIGFYGWFVLGLFLLGAWFVRSGAIARPQAWPRTHAALRWVALPVGLVLTVLAWWRVPNTFYAGFDFGTMLAASMQMIGGALMALGYLGWLVRALQAANPAGWPSWLAPAGRMALSNYLMQSLVMTLVFYHYGLGLFEQVPRAWQAPLAIGFFLLQAVFSRWWLGRFHMGPVEWLWRAATYGRLPPMRR